MSIFKKAFNNVIRFNVDDVKLMLRLFQENKSYDIKTNCIHPLMSRPCTSLRHIWHNYNISVCKICKKPVFLQKFSHQSCENLANIFALEASLAFHKNVKRDFLSQP